MYDIELYINKAFAKIHEMYDTELHINIAFTKNKHEILLHTHWYDSGLDGSMGVGLAE